MSDAAAGSHVGGSSDRWLEFGCARAAILRPLAAVEPDADEPATTFAVDPGGWTR